MTRMRKMLHDSDSPCIQSLAKLAETQSKATLVLWALGYSEKVILPVWRKAYPEDLRPSAALEAAREWLSGSIKLPQARAAILECHAAAREAEANPAAQAAARAIAHSASTIHSPKHCMGLPRYGALAVAFDALGADATWDQLERYAADECGRMIDALRTVAVQDEPNPKSIDGYIAAQPEEVQPLLQSIRETIHKAAPKAIERISYRMPTFWQGENLVHFAAFEKHIGLYPGGEATSVFAEELAGYKTSKGAIRLPLDKPIDHELIAEIVRWRMEQAEKVSRGV